MTRVPRGSPSSSDSSNLGDGVHGDVGDSDGDILETIKSQCEG